MKKLSIFLIMIGGVVFAPKAQALDSLYHSLDEVYAIITSWQQQYPELVWVDTIGYSQQDHLPIWAVKISDNVQQDEDEAAVLFVGQVHAEELEGEEICLAMIEDIVTHRNQYPWKAWVQNVETWIVPTANPEGNQVIFDGLDDAYRKNKRDCNLNGIFDYTPGLGGDIDGVDVNRNFPLNWAKGDTFMMPGGEEYYDYFRGFSPLSESESQALWQLTQEQKFAFSIVYHSSRSGNFSEKVYYPWGWAAGKNPPDFNVIDSTGYRVAYSIRKLTSGFYEPAPTESPRGDVHCSQYAYWGTIAFLIETGPGIQNPYPTTQQIVANNLPGAYYLLNRACGYDGTIMHAEVTGKVSTSGTQPLPAIVSIAQLDGPILKPRTCDAAFGRYRRYVLPGTYTVKAHLRGYYSQTKTAIANASGATTCNFTLLSKPMYSFYGQFKALNGSPLPGTLFISGEDVADTIQIPADGHYYLSLPEGGYRITFDHAGYVVRSDTVPIFQNRNITFECSPGTLLFQDDFEGGLGAWSSGGTPNYWGIEQADSLWTGGTVLTDYPYHDYTANTESWIEPSTPLNLSNELTASLKFQHWCEFEPGYDWGEVQISDNGGFSWERLSGPFWAQDAGWSTVYADLTPYCGSNDVRLRWLVHSDNTLEWRGWRIDNVEVQAANEFSAVKGEIIQPNDYALVSAFPNPFNSQLTVNLILPRSANTTISIYDISGREIGILYQGELSPGEHRINYRMPTASAAGIYLLRINSGDTEVVNKILYLK
ncbi:MAG: M14 family zinc carboxypeptidase [bacterium]|nr:M14 family zinc carboxypeptidase [bacterium]